MKYTLLIVGAILVVFGVVDMAGSFAEFDLWGEIMGVELPEIVWQYSAYGEMLLGYFIFKAGLGIGTAEEEVVENC